MRRNNTKIPGILPPPPKSEIDGKITDLSSKTVLELEELRDRQLKLLLNINFISKLSDKGAKLQAFHDKIVNEIKRKQEDQTRILLNNLRLNDVDKESIQDVEWEGNLKNKNDLCLDSDDDSEPEDVLQILSQSTVKEKTAVTLPAQKPLVTLEDLLKIGEIPHINYIVNKTENNPNPIPNKQFKPFKTTKTNVHDPSKEIHRKKHKNWEVTAATPPPMVHGPTKILTLEDSLKLQKDYNLHLKEVETRHASEKLMAATRIKMGQIPQDVIVLGTYREIDSDNSVSGTDDGSDKEVHDEESESGVVFTVMR